MINVISKIISDLHNTTTAVEKEKRKVGKRIFDRWLVAHRRVVVKGGKKSRR